MASIILANLHKVQKSVQYMECHLSGSPEFPIRFADDIVVVSPETMLLTRGARTTHLTADNMRRYGARSESADLRGLAVRAATIDEAMVNRDKQINPSKSLSPSSCTT